MYDMEGYNESLAVGPRNLVVGARRRVCGAGDVVSAAAVIGRAGATEGGEEQHAHGELCPLHHPNLPINPRGARPP